MTVSATTMPFTTQLERIDVLLFQDSSPLCRLLWQLVVHYIGDASHRRGWIKSGVLANETVRFRLERSHSHHPRRQFDTPPELIGFRRLASETSSPLNPHQDFVGDGTAHGASRGRLALWTPPCGARPLAGPRQRNGRRPPLEDVIPAGAVGKGYLAITTYPRKVGAGRDPRGAQKDHSRCPARAT
jgi:hypothetical protein